MDDRAKKCRERRMPAVGETASFTECTGLMPTPPLGEDEEEAYRELYSTELPENAHGDGKRRKES